LEYGTYKQHGYWLCQLLCSAPGTHTIISACGTGSSLILPSPIGVSLVPAPQAELAAAPTRRESPPRKGAGAALPPATPSALPDGLLLTAAPGSQG